MSAIETSAPGKQHPDQVGSRSTHLQVRGLGCDGCRRKLQSALLAHPQVRTAQVDLHPGAPADVEVGHDPGLVHADLVQAIGAAGFTVVAQPASR